MTRFSLHPFPGQDSGGITIHGTIKRTEQSISLSFCLQGNLDDLVLPTAPTRERRDNLWQATCLEMFWSEEGRKNYGEMNLAPNGAWNVYGFTEYRAGMHREERVSEPAVTTARTPDTFTLTAQLDIASLLGSPPIRIGVSAVLQHRDNRLSYWALTHPAEKPDFHAPQTFLLRL
ncbi:DOMON-like domain-containing protein [Thiovibrio frasassiensis]|uniref:DOMON-like domain-containing protein n=1 Tax=Thiovibrio frasassiensis TaxID=2984131 RepID=A0A9X4RPA5_9BACT|nr:DOMON-like domain-containing protein [Thiovibrio frasassiensis]MDG4475042.1 DOMON-like domain-containing protein [Thiovibrio frasassiensis]